MKPFFAAVGRVSQVLASLTMVMLGVLVLLVTADVVVRTANLRPLAWASSAAEYILLYTTFLPMAALVRGKGHVFVEFIREPMPPALKRACERGVYIVCIALCAYLAWIASTHFVNAIRTGAYETRSLDMPLWVVYLPMALGLWLSTLEWLRFLLGFDSMYEIDPLKMDGY
jgi:TRAP-type C4-dicarboxylate transport system permease small subunit